MSTEGGGCSYEVHRGRLVVTAADSSAEAGRVQSLIDNQHMSSDIAAGQKEKDLVGATHPRDPFD